MQHIQRGYQSLSLLMQVNWDRFLYAGAIGLALCAGAWIGSFAN